MYKRFVFPIFLAVLNVMAVDAQNQPTGLMTDLIERTDVVYVNGYPTNMALEDIHLAIEPVQVAEIATPDPKFSWIIDGNGASDVMQTAYQIVLYQRVSQDGSNDRKVVWDSGKVESGESSSVAYGGPALQGSQVYYWTVKTWDSHGSESEPSEPKAFKTAAVLERDAVSIEPLVKTDQFPVSVVRCQDGNYFLDFGKDAFGQMRVTLTADGPGEKVILHLGERIRDGRVDREPFGTCRYRRVEMLLQPGTHTYQVKILPDKRNTHGDAVLMPGYIGEVLPFRYVELEGYGQELNQTDIVRLYVHHPFDSGASYFRSSNDTLNQLWELCKYSMEATSFTGYHIDGDRERIPYEYDALVNQYVWYASDRSYTITRRTVDYLLDHPTWPTEWILQTVLLAYNDYLYTGDTRLLEARYELLGRHTLIDLQETNGLVSTRIKEQDSSFLKSINRTKPIRDIVDWPQGKGSFGLPDSHPGEADFFQFTDYNAVVNAYHYRTLVCMEQIAAALGREDEAGKWKKEAAQVKTAYNALFFDKKKNWYRDGIGVGHSALHSCMFPMAFGMASPKQMKKLAEYITTKGTACSIANAMILMDALYDSYASDYALSLLTATDDRSFYNTILAGSTITMEAWDDRYKQNQDWNHAWGACVGDILPHKFLGVEPLSPGWSRMRIRPQIFSVQSAEACVPTIKGPVRVKVSNGDKTVSLSVNVPANTSAMVYVPVPRGLKNPHLTINGESVAMPVPDPDGRFIIVENVGSGQKTFVVD